MLIDRERLAWAAGLFEGEGCFALSKCRHYRNIRASLASADKDVVLGFAKCLGFGGLSIQQPSEVGTKQLLRWSASSFEHCQFTICLLWPWLGKRRRTQALKLLRLMRDYHAGGHVRAYRRGI